MAPESQRWHQRDTGENWPCFKIRNDGDGECARRLIARSWLDQLQKLHARNGLADEGRLERSAPLLMQVTQRLLALEGTPDGPVTPRALLLLQDAIRNFSPMSQELLLTGLNLIDRSESTLTDRIGAIASTLGFDEPATLGDRERGLYQPLADFVLEELQLVNARKTHEALVSGDGDATAAALLIAEHYKYYFRIFTPVYAVARDLETYLIRRRRQPGKDLSAVLRTLIWRYTQWQLALSMLIEDLGGNWIVSTPEAEDELVNSEYEARVLLPISEHDESKLRLALRRADTPELESFESELDKSVRTRVVRRLKNWADRCDCNPRRPKRSCEPHRTVKVCDTFTTALEREWYRLGAWYHLPPETVPAERDISGEYFFKADPDNYDLERLDR